MRAAGAMAHGTQDARGLRRRADDSGFSRVADSEVRDARGCETGLSAGQSGLEKGDGEDGPEGWCEVFKAVRAGRDRGCKPGGASI